MLSTFITREGYDKLQSELDQLRTVGREEVALRLHEAIDGGELSENVEYEAAKNEQAFVEGRILELEILLANARIIEDNGKSDIVRVGATVTIQEHEGELEVYKIVGAAEANPRNGLISNVSPLGRVLLDRKAGDEVVVNAPAGSFKVKIIAVE